MADYSTCENRPYEPISTDLHTGHCTQAASPLPCWVMSTLLQANKLCLTHGQTDRLRDFDLSLDQGEIVGLLGLNGAGKSTALALLAGTLAPSSGQLLIRGQALRDKRELGRHIGLLPQQPPLYPELTVSENLDYAGTLRGLRGHTLKQAHRQISQQLDLDGLQRQTAAHLSTGMATRLGLAMALIHKPDILLLDEPTAGLDPLQTTQLHELIQQQADHCAVLISSHLLGDIEVLCSRVILLHRGNKISEERLAQEQLISCEFSRAPSDQTLTSLPGIAAVQHRDGNRLLLQLDEQATAVMAERVSGHGWGLRSWQRADNGLRERFHALNEESHP